MGDEFDLYPAVRCSSLRRIVRHPRCSIAHSDNPHTVWVYSFPGQVTSHTTRPEGWQTPVVFATTKRVSVTSYGDIEICFLYQLSDQFVKSY